MLTKTLKTQQQSSERGRTLKVHLCSNWLRRHDELKRHQIQIWTTESLQTSESEAQRRVEGKSSDWTKADALGGAGLQK